MELRIMFEHLLARLPEWHLAPGSEPQVLAATFARAWDAVHVEFDPASVTPALAPVG
jgi:cytochrome P450 family 142 subfamily A polypeptide 1